MHKNGPSCSVLFCGRLGSRRGEAPLASSSPTREATPPPTHTHTHIFPLGSGGGHSAVGRGPVSFSPWTTTCVVFPRVGEKGLGPSTAQWPLARGNKCCSNPHPIPLGAHSSFFLLSTPHRCCWSGLLGVVAQHTAAATDRVARGGGSSCSSSRGQQQHSPDLDLSRVRAPISSAAARGPAAAAAAAPSTRVCGSVDRSTNPLRPGSHAHLNGA